ncbi:MAG: diphthine synthase [Nitrososphaerales archaeon]
MSSLIFVGLGLADQDSLSLEGLECVKSADKVYLEVYTSPVSSGLKKRLKDVIGSKIDVVSREFIEDGRQMIEESRRGTVVLLSYGDPMVATTHMDLRVRASNEGVETRVIHNASILAAIPGETGLHAYSFGKTVTMTQSGATPQTTVYNTVFENLLRRLHTVILLEYDYASGFFLDPSRALDELLETERELKQNIFDDDTFLVVASRVGRRDQSIEGGHISSLRQKRFGEPPHVLVIPGRFHFTETDALKALLKVGDEEVGDNSARVFRLSEGMVKRYVKKGRSALNRARSRCSRVERKRYTTLFENVECYISDAERFLNQGRDELAVLSIGYAEGLLDALRFLPVGEFGDIWEE